MRIRSELIKRGSQIPYKVFRSGGYEHYNVRIFLDDQADVLDGVDHVEYLLHPSFAKRRRVSSDRESQFAIEIWTWGMFEVSAQITYEDGSVEEQTHYLKYNLPEDDGTNYVAV